jgi:hypothetical protein
MVSRIAVRNRNARISYTTCVSEGARDGYSLAGLAVLLGNLFPAAQFRQKAEYSSPKSQKKNFRKGLTIVGGG